MRYIGIDLGAKTVTGITALNSDETLISSEAIPHDEGGKNPLEHRMYIVGKIEEIISGGDGAAIIFEKIRLFRAGHVSPLSNIISLCKLQTTIINSLSDRADIYEINVQSWKAKILRSGKATKEDAVEFVTKYYPQISLEIIKGKRKKKIEICHDQADSVCLAVYACRHLSDAEKVSHQ